MNLESNGAHLPLKKRQKYDERRTRCHVASLVGMKSVCPRAIAYIAVQVCLLSFEISFYVNAHFTHSYVSFVLLCPAVIVGELLTANSTMMTFTTTSLISLRIPELQERRRLFKICYCGGTGQLHWLISILTIRLNCERRQIFGRATVLEYHPQDVHKLSVGLSLQKGRVVVVSNLPLLWLVHMLICQWTQ